MARIELPEPEANRVHLKIDLRPGEDLRARGRLEAAWECENDVFRCAELHASTRDDALEDLRSRVLPEEVKWQAFDEEFSIEAKTVAYTCSLEVEGMVEDAGSLMLVDVSRLKIDDLDLDATKPRKSGIRYPFPVQYRSSVSVHAPEGYEVESAQRSFRKSESFLDVVLQPMVGTDQVKLERKVELRHNLLRAQAAEPLTKLIGEVDAAVADPIVLRHVSDKTGSEGIADPAGTEQGALRGDEEEERASTR
jgi:hypothetical protein